MTVRELYEQLGLLLETEGDKEVFVKVYMEDYMTADLSLYNDGDNFYIEID